MAGLAQEKLRAREQWGQDPCGAEYDREHELGTREFFDRIERHRYSEYAPWMPRLMEFENFRDARLLEIGCGMGTDLLQFSRGGARCIGIDLTSRSIEITQHRFKLYGAHGAFMISDGEHLPFRDESFDVVYSNGVLHHTPDPRKAFLSLASKVKKGGHISAWVYGAENNEWITKYVNPVREGFTSKISQPVLYQLSKLPTLSLFLTTKLVYRPANIVANMFMLRWFSPM